MTKKTLKTIMHYTILGAVSATTAFAGTACVNMVDSRTGEVVSTNDYTDDVVAVGEMLIDAAEVGGEIALGITNSALRYNLRKKEIHTWKNVRNHEINTWERVITRRRRGGRSR